MKKKIIYIVFLFFFWGKSEASPIKYDDYLSNVLSGIESIKSKKSLVNAAERDYSGSVLYAVPKVSASLTPKKNRSEDYSEGKLTVSSLLIDDTIHNAIKEKYYKLLSSKIDLNTEKERIINSIMKDVITISLYENLRSEALKLKEESESLYNKINTKFSFGIIKESDVQLGSLLVQKINTEIDNIENEIERLKINIEMSALQSYPVNGIHIEKEKINALINYADINNLYNNLELKNIMMKKNAAKESALQQNSLFSISAVAENKWRNTETVREDSYIGLKISLNIFDIESNLAESSGLERFRSLSWDYEERYKFLMHQVKLINLTSEANVRELNNLEGQSQTTAELIKNQEREYGINQTSVYEMLNTRYDYFQLEKAITEIKISQASNKMDLLKANGQLIYFFMSGYDETEIHKNNSTL
ncbi:TPA: hypothetical protein ACHKG7_002921 [Escherichia coli]|nr:hypothetical protein [Escherichia coli]